MQLPELRAAYKRIGIGLNLRAQTHDAAFHARINPGTKLINCIGFGIPSISSDEPAYREIGQRCTQFSEPKDCAAWVSRLQDDDLYHWLRQQCICIAPRFHISAIVHLYRTLLIELHLTS
jgi:hypothetical protein